jgi:hypothetical protein
VVFGSAVDHFSAVFTANGILSGCPMNGGAARLAEVIRADEGLARVMSQVFSAENRSALKAAGAQLRSFADQLRAAWARLLEGLRPLARSIAAVLSVPALATTKRF